MLARVLSAAGCAVLTVAVATAVAPSASAVSPTITPGATAYSAAAGTGTAALRASLELKGSLGQLLDYLIGPIVSQDLNPLVAALQGTVSDAVGTTLGTSGDLNAATDPSQSQYGTAPAAFPNDTLPSPCAASGAQPCYSAASASVSGAPLASVSLGLLNGYVEQVASSADATNPVFARANAANPQVSVLPAISSLVPQRPSAVNPLVSATAVSAKANCPNDGAVGATKPLTAPSASTSTSGVTLLGGLVTFGVLDGQLTSLVVNNVPYASVLQLSTVTVAGVTVSPFGQGVRISIPLSVGQVLTGLGLPGAVATALNDYSPTSTVTLSLIVGANTTVTTRTATAWGLGIGVDLSGALSFNLLGLVTANVNIPSGIGSGNLGNVLDLRLGYTACQSGINLGSGTVVPLVPAALV